MAVIHNTTMNPGKLELLATWLPTRPWYRGTAAGPEPVKAGGFRLDDPEGEVGLEFMVVADVSGPEPVAYHVPVTYRGAPLDGAEEGLIGTSEHGVLGRRWVYDGAHDPVWVERLLALFRGEAEPQQQSVSGTPDPSVARHLTGPAVRPGSVADGVTEDGQGTGITLRAGDGSGPLTVGVARVLGEERYAEAAGAARGRITAGWHLPDGSEHRAPFFHLG
ncbi:1,4-alpha-glucan branching protein [Streptomyces sp. HNM0574]|uniref:maltokinase N-terminal cap-like domain-containing protein n=1 Tax=Streptomyces sp. HNM0574 TaxID=2714954 RepID=UPI00146DB581|nr:1,4-alpha-glucan branching protein [Streptomyces sp. HNM0574]NLU68850.1 1,4-alpha-glucan branching protein [Streptomyces sp. HNM0574]